MAKKDPETIDRYKIFAETSMEQMGFVLAALTRMGLQNIGYELITDVNLFKTKERKVHEVSVEDFAAEYVKAHPRFKSTELVAHFKAAGRTPSGAYYAIKRLTEANVVRKSGDEIVRVEALAAPEQKRTGHYAVANKDLIANAIKGRKQFAVRELRDLFVKEGRPEKSISPILSRMVQHKEVKLVSTGQYIVLAKGAKVAAEAPAPAHNGAMMNGSGVAAHG
jgi:hypothetical protein